MKKLILIVVLFINTVLFSQEHFAGLTTSSRSGIITAGMNPAELANLSNKYEVNIFGLSVNAANNKIGFSDLTSDNIENLLFVGDEPVNMRFDAELYGPGVAIRYNKWVFGLTTKANGKLDIIDVDTKLGDAISNSGLNSLLASTFLSNGGNQRIIGTTWGEVNLNAARTLYENSIHKINGGIAFKLLFPGSYANLGAGQFTGTISQSLGQGYLTDANANLNIAYSGSLANSFSNFDHYAKSVYGGLNGFATDFGINYQWKDEDTTDDGVSNNAIKNRHKLNAGIAIRNMGSMTFKDDNNNSTNYKLEIQGSESLNLNQFENVDNLQEIETILLNSGYLTKQNGSKDFKVNLPATVSLYADVKVIPILYVSAFLQQRMKDDNENDQITAQNIFTLTPRVYLGSFEAYLPLSNSDISGFNTGIGFQYRGFYIGSGSIITALINDSKQADAYVGFRWGFL